MSACLFQREPIEMRHDFIDVQDIGIFVVQVE
jgi:hypothetical protein